MEQALAGASAVAAGNAGRDGEQERNEPPVLTEELFGLVSPGHGLIRRYTWPYAGVTCRNCLAYACHDFAQRLLSGRAVSICHLAALIAYM